MTDEQKAAYVIAQAAVLNATIAGMQAANSQFPEDQPHMEADFQKAIDASPCCHNAVMVMFHG